MKRRRTAVFVDTSYLVAVIDPRDSLHRAALELTRRLSRKKAPLVTSDLVLIELANYCARGPLRSVAISWIDGMRAAVGWEVVRLEPDDLREGEARYRSHHDENWSLTDCVVMELMKRRAMTDIATFDSGFEQAGFSALLRRRN